MFEQSLSNTHLSLRHITTLSHLRALNNSTSCLGTILNRKLPKKKKSEKWGTKYSVQRTLVESLRPKSSQSITPFHFSWDDACWATQFLLPLSSVCE